MLMESGRINDSIVSLQFDKFLNPEPIHTYICYGPFEYNHPQWGKYGAEFDLLETYRNYGIDTTNISLIYEKDLADSYPIKADIFNLPNGLIRDREWLKQQLLKLIAIDVCPYDKILLQDSDILATKLYKYFDNDPINFISVNTAHSKGYYENFTALTGLPRQSDFSFVCEFFPLHKSTWISLKQHIEKHCGTDWLNAICNLIKNNKSPQCWFSEYELLGNWALWQQPNIKTTVQHKLFLNDMHEIYNIKNLKNGGSERTWHKDINCIGLHVNQDNLECINDIVSNINSCS